MLAGGVAAEAEASSQGQIQTFLGGGANSKRMHIKHV